MSELPRPTARPRLTVAIPTYRGRHLLEVILPSLAAQRFRDFEVVVVDDGSGDDTPRWLSECWPEVTVHARAENVGVTRALNLCLNAGAGELVGLFNNDLELDPGCLESLVAALDAHPEAGWAGAKLLNFHDRGVIDGAGDTFSWGRGGHRRGHGEIDTGQYDSPCAIFGACGGAAVFRRCALERVGALDETFFTFYEDIDWDFRAQLVGFTCRYVPSAVAYHMGSATIGAGLSDFTRYHLWRNGLWVLAKNAPARLLVRHGPEILLGQLLNLAVAVRDRTLGTWVRAWRDAIRGLPHIIRRRRAIQAHRSLDDRGLEAVIGREATRP
jgi:GT2 family glycosyltransferase